MLLKNIDPFVRQALVGSVGAKTPNDVFFELRTPDSRLYYISSGEGEIIVAGERHTLSSGTVVLFRAGVRYTWCPREGGSIEYIALNFDFTHSASDVTRTFHPVHSHLFSDSDVLESVTFEDATVLNEPIILHSTGVSEGQFRQLATEYSLRGEYSDELLSSSLKTIIIEIVRETENSLRHVSDGRLALVREVIRYIQKNYRDEITYATLGEEFHLNPIYLNRVFKEYMGTSLHAFILNHRINTAMELLRASSLPVKEISALVGFCDFPHFLKTFKRISGKTPHAYRTSVDR